MNLEDRKYYYLNGHGDRPRVGTALASITECGARGYQVEFRFDTGVYEADEWSTLAEARAAVDEAITQAAGEIERARHDTRKRILQHPWWIKAVEAEELDKLIEQASNHAGGVVLVDPRGGYAWLPQDAWQRGRHLRLPIPKEGHSIAGATFALWDALNEAMALDLTLQGKLEAGCECD